MVYRANVKFNEHINTFLCARLADRRKCCSLSWYRILAGAAQIPFGDE